MDAKFVKTNVPGLNRDTSTGMIINTSESQYEDFLSRRANSKRIKELDSEINGIRNELSEIKQLLLKVLDK